MAKHIDDKLLPPTREQSDYIKRQGHPYAKLSVTVSEESASVVEQRTDARYARTTASQKELEDRCRQIFSLHTPEVERGKLRPIYRDFIARNRVKSSEVRFRVLKLLQKYDLSDLGLQPQFNREKEELTEAKLKEIERAAENNEE